MSHDTQENVNDLVFMKDDAYYICDYIFYGSMHDKPFNGATFTVLSPVAKSYYEEATSVEGVTERYRDIWAESVNANTTDDSLKDWIEDNFFSYGADNIDESVFDFSGYDYWDKIRDLGFDEDSYPVIECIGGGRSFRLNPDKVYNWELWQKVCKAEGYIVGCK